MPHRLLRVIGEAAERVIPSSREMLVVSAAGRQRVVVEEQPVDVPLIDLGLADHYALGGLIDAGCKYGTQMAALLPYVWQGERRYLRGAVVPLLRGPSVIVPLGFFSGGLN